MAGELVKAAAKLTAVPMMPGGVVANVADHLQVPSSSRMPVSAMAGLTSRGEAAGELMPRVVFDALPTRVEAQEATSELVDAIGRIYPWSRESGSSSNSQVGAAVVALDSDETIMGSRVPTLFNLLHLPAVQNVVCSLASDQNMFGALHGNQDFQEFRRQCILLSRQPSRSLVTGALPVLPEGPRIGHSSEDEDYQSRISFEDLFNTIHGIVDVILESFSGFVNLFRGEGASSSAANHGTDPGASEHGHITESAILSMVLAVIMLIFLRRLR